MNYSKDILFGVVWTAIQTIVNKSFSFIVKLILARLLFPEDFGIVGMATVFISLVEVFSDLGMSAALIQKKDEEITPNHYHTAFWVGIVWSILVYLVISLGVSKFAAWFYSEDQLEVIIPIISLSILISPLNLVHKAKLTRELKFKKIAIINNIASISSGVFAIILAFWGFGVMSLAFNLLVFSLVSLPLFFFATKWKPKLIWEKKCFIEIFRFGLFTVGTKLFNKISSQSDYLIVGKLLGASTLGIYTLAFVLTNVLRDQIVTIVNQVMYPVYTKIQSNNSLLVKNYLYVLNINNLMVYPIVVCVILFSPNFVPLFFGVKWVSSVVIIRVLSLSVLIQMLNNSHTSLIRSSGRADIEFKLQLTKSLLFFIPSIFIGTYYYGIIGTAIAYTFSKTMSVLLSFYVMYKLFGITFIKTLQTVFPAFKNAIISTAITIFIIYLTNNWIIGLITFCVLSVLLILHYQKAEINHFKSLIRKL